ncbi:MAG: hypothetical protein JNM50_10245 [Chromatiales bacterium]|jgi:hypothetical protein|nr:hypothetical protein [Chromatiales bacterium]
MRRASLHCWPVSLLLVIGVAATAAPPDEAAPPSATGVAAPAAPVTPGELDDPAAAGESAAVESSEPPPTGDTANAAAPDSTTAVPVEGTAVEENWIDWVHEKVYRGVDGTGHWVDGFFAGKNPAETRKPTIGRLGLGGYWDQRDAFDPSFRLRARVPFENMRNRVGLIFGRGPEREVVENRPRAGTDSLPNRFNDIQDDAWLLGLGFNSRGDLSRGLALDAAVRLRADPELLARAVYRWNVEISDRTLLRPSQTAFWRRTRGFGGTTDLTLDHLLGNRFLVRTAIAGTVAEDTDGIEWQSYATLYQDLKGRDTLAWSVVAAGETNAPVELQNYGFQVRYRRRILREWLFLELLQSVTWPRELVTEDRELNLGFGVGIEMYFGPVPQNQLR